MKILTPELEKKAQKLLGYNIHMLRMMRGFSQKDIADALHKSANAVSNWELGNTGPSIDDLLKLCDMFKVTPNQILGWDECPELIEFIKKTESLGPKVEELKKQKREIENRIKLYNEILNRKD
jgi:repressor LexA